MNPISNGNGENRGLRQPTERRSELINRVKYTNTLPDIPFDLKFITYPFHNERFVAYNATSLEQNYRYEVLTEHDLGVTIDLINRDLYKSDPCGQLHPDDEKLLEEDVHTPKDSMRSKYHAKSVSWLRKSEYISTEQTRFQPQTMEKVEAKVGFNVKKSFVEQTLYMDRETQIKAIQKTFEENKAPLQNHYSKPNVTAIETFQFFPDFTNWKYPCAQVIFDSDPAESGKNIPAQIEEMSQAMIRGVMDESGEQFVAYFLPTKETLEKRRRDVTNNIIYEDDEDYEYKMAREYNWNVKSKASKGYEENYFLVVRADGIYYNELETRVRLNKRRQKIGQLPSSTKLVVKHLPLKASEYRMQRYRARQLEAPGGDEEEELEDSEEEIAAADLTQIDKTEETENKNVADDRKSNDCSKSRSRSRSKSGSKHGSTRSRSSSRSKSRSISRESRKNRKRYSSSSRSRTHSRSSSRPKSKSRSSRSLSNGSNQSNSRSSSKSDGNSPMPASKRLERSISRSKSDSRHSSRSKSSTSDHEISRSDVRKKLFIKLPAKSNSQLKSRSRSKSASHSTDSRRPSRSKSRSRSIRRSVSQVTQKSRSRSQSKSADERSGSHKSANADYKSDSSRNSKSPSRSLSKSSDGSGSNSDGSRSVSPNGDTPSRTF